MALQKEIKQSDEVVTLYHRVLFVRITTNSHNSVAIVSYVDKESRSSEQKGESSPYRQSVTYETDYDPGMTVEKAYDFLKTLPEFEGAEDV